MSPDDPRQGTYAGYQAGCRCDACRTAGREYVKQWRARIKGSLAADDPRHGTYHGHANFGCRCVRCRAAHARGQGESWLRIADRLDAEAAAGQP